MTSATVIEMVSKQVLSNDENPCYLLYIGDSTTQLYMDFHKLRIPMN